MNKYNSSISIKRFTICTSCKTTLIFFFFVFFLISNILWKISVCLICICVSLCGLDSTRYLLVAQKLMEKKHKNLNWRDFQINKKLHQHHENETSEQFNVDIAKYNTCVSMAFFPRVYFHFRSKFFSFFNFIIGLWFSTLDCFSYHIFMIILSHSFSLSHSVSLAWYNL